MLSNFKIIKSNIESFLYIYFQQTNDMHKKLAPETQMLGYGYNPQWSEGAIKCPIFQTSTFVFKSAEEGKEFFEFAYGKKEMKEGDTLGLIYSRINNPDLQILEERLALWDSAEDCAVFESGMSAITTTLMEFLKPGDVLLHSNTLYGGTDHYIHHILPLYNIETIPYSSQDSKSMIEEKINGKEDRIKLIYTESPANPNNDLIDIEMLNEIRNEKATNAIIAVDNTYMGPLWCHPMQHGADLVIYSATKYIGGHSDVIAGAVSGKKEEMIRIKTLRTFLGNMAGPWTGWLLLRSLETLKIRMEEQARNAQKVAEFLQTHPNVEKVYYLGFIDESDPSYLIYKRQYSCAGAMLSFDVKGGEKEAFTVLNSLKHIKLAVSLGSTESLAQHPYTMTHAGVDDELKQAYQVTEKMIRLSVGVENYNDLNWDLGQALDKI